MSWFLLFLAGLCEIVWALALKYCDGFTKWGPVVILVVFTIISFYLLSLATRQIPIGIAYAVWSGTGAIGDFLGNIYLLNERPS
ncbi:MAG TPA: multidrug efflux SMR transporter, partial [Opitutales bacterium]|nr:multidrug efflux SMR transporter [Opitutales bacterium]